MTALGIGIVSLAMMVVLIIAGLHVAISLLLLSFVGVWLMRDNIDVALALMAQATNDSIASHEFGVVPLFVLMGLLVATADLGKDIFEVANSMLRRIRGGLGVATVMANAVFAAITGISIASAAVFTKVAVPEMLRFGFTPRFATGVVAGSSVLGMLIPPSLLMILYAFLSEQSVGRAARCRRRFATRRWSAAGRRHAGRRHRPPPRSRARQAPSPGRAGPADARRSSLAAASIRRCIRSHRPRARPPFARTSCGRRLGTGRSSLRSHRCQFHRCAQAPAVARERGRHWR